MSKVLKCDHRMKELRNIGLCHAKHLLHSSKRVPHISRNRCCTSSLPTTGTVGTGGEVS